MSQIISFSLLSSAELVVDAIYQSSSDGTLAGEPISKLLPGSGNMGGFRISGRGNKKSWVVLFSTGEDKDWPDSLDIYSGQFIYYGDNKTPGHEIHQTSAGGNKVLRSVFGQLHQAETPRCNIPPFFLFKKYPTANGTRSVQFKGLAVPGYPGLSSTEDLVAVWKSTEGQRFQNYRSIFTVLDASVINREWVNDLAAGNSLTDNAPKAWYEWVETGKYLPLRAESTTVIRSIEEQTPDTPLKRDVLNAVWEYFREAPFEFEKFAARIYRMMDQRVIVDEITRGVIDGGRDAVGRYLLGLPSDPVYAEFSLEAKCYRPQLNGQSPNTVGVKEVSRLISRIRHRQFGILVTTSLVARQAYEEVREDRHPIIFISGRDIAEILIKNGFNSIVKVNSFLNNEFKIKGT